MSKFVSFLTLVFLFSTFSVVCASTITLDGTIRDFKADYYNFEGAITGYVPGMVETTLGADGTPTYKGDTRVTFLIGIMMWVGPTWLLHTQSFSIMDKPIQGEFILIQAIVFSQLMVNS